jgi:hypothetical protein
MDVIGHDDVPPNGDLMFIKRAISKFLESVMNWLIRENLATPLRVKGHKVKRPDVEAI